MRKVSIFDWFSSMEGEAGSEGDNKRKRGGADDNSNDNNGSNSKIANSNEGQSKPKRQMKTPFQLQNLEKAYALDTYPSEAMRLELSEKLGLSDWQLQMWFCHRRLKEFPPKKRLRKVAAEPLPDSPTDDMRLDPEIGNEYGSGSGSEGDNKRKRGGADDNSNDNNGSNSKIANSNAGQSKPKRQMKTPFQLQNLEKAYALDIYPSEAMRLELSEKLGLSDWQLQMWLKELPLKKRLRKVAAEPLPDSPTDDMRLDPELGNEYGSGSGSGSSALTRSESRNAMPQGLPGYYESPQAGMERRAIASVEAQLGEPLREDGPILGVEFDPLPPDAFGAPVEASFKI
ncbi:homeobox-DDT domain protein RLT1-like [Gastrolobium bilobum]|uniref:homeobox-DDT domain protein RLT1-like n=1 Tax=Gastrolobium bilobum TaxID=150636 RepID=UPI002AB2A28F|nr:homeobox-DDT domain protein RLT1-like [Gastrolobium bilobum]